MTAVVLTKNEAAAITQCLRSLSAFDELVVVDSNSTDGTSALAVQEGARVDIFTWNGKYPKKKQWVLDNVRARNDWLLFVDADERPTADLVEELRHIRWDLPDLAAVDIPLSYVWLGKPLRYGHQVRKRAIVHRHRCRFPELDDLQVSTMWEVEGHYQPVAAGTVLRTSHRMLHDDPDPLFDYFSRHNRYSDWEAHLRRSPSARKQLSGARRRHAAKLTKWRGLVFFVYSYVLRLGILDGKRGFHYALAQGFYYWQVGLKASYDRAKPEIGA